VFGVVQLGEMIQNLQPSFIFQKYHIIILQSNELAKSIKTLQVQVTVIKITKSLFSYLT